MNDSRGFAWRADLGPSIVVLLISIPLSMGIAIASGVPPARGLATAIVGGLVVGRLAGSPLQISGPSAGLAVMVLEVVNGYGLEALAIVVPLMGILQGGAGLLRLGQLFRAVSPAVINGMLAGIGVLIFSSQFHVAVDDAPKGSGLQNLISIPQAIYKGVVPMDGSVHEQAALIGLLTLVVLVVMGALRKTVVGKIPPPLAAVGVATAATILLDLPILRVEMPSSFLDALAPPQASQLSLLTDVGLLVSAVALAFVASAETLLCATAVDGMNDGPRTDYDRELFAQGVGNTICGLVGAPPMTGVITRSSANVAAGATSRASAIMLGTWLLLFMAVFPTAFSVIPRASLAALLVYIGYKLVRARPYAELKAHGRTELAIFGITLAIIVGVNLLTGILTGLALALLKLLITGGRGFHRFHIERHDSGHVVDLHLRGAASFVRIPRLAATLDKVPLDKEVHLHVEELDYIDHACLELLDRWECGRIRARAPVRVEWQTLKHRYHARNLLDPKPAGHSEAPPAGTPLFDVVTPQRIIIAPAFEDKWQAIEMLGEKLAQQLGISPRDFVSSVRERENLASTCLGGGLMMPHGALPAGSNMACALALSSEGWDFGALDGKNVQCIALLATPQDDARRHLAVLAAFARLFSVDSEVRNALLRADTPERAHQVLQGEEARSVNVSFQSRTNEMAALHVEDVPPRPTPPSEP